MRKREEVNRVETHYASFEANQASSSMREES